MKVLKIYSQFIQTTQWAWCYLTAFNFEGKMLSTQRPTLVRYLPRFNSSLSSENITGNFIMAILDHIVCIPSASDRSCISCSSKCRSIQQTEVSWPKCFTLFFSLNRITQTGKLRWKKRLPLRRDFRLLTFFHMFFICHFSSLVQFTHSTDFTKRYEIFKVVRDVFLEWLFFCKILCAHIEKFDFFDFRCTHQ